MLFYVPNNNSEPKKSYFRKIHIPQNTRHIIERKLHFVFEKEASEDTNTHKNLFATTRYYKI